MYSIYICEDIYIYIYIYIYVVIDLLIEYTLCVYIYIYIHTPAAACRRGGARRGGRRGGRGSALQALGVQAAIITWSLRYSLTVDGYDFGPLLLRPLQLLPLETARGIHSHL